MYKQLASAGFVSLILLNLAAEGRVVPIESVPNPRLAYGGWVTDMADLLDPATEAELNRSISRLQARNGSEMAIVTVPNTAPAASPKAFTTQLFNTWGIGKKGQNNGVLVMISRGDRRVEIETGRGVRTLLPDAAVKTIIQQQMMPQFKQGNFNAGTLAGSRAMITVLNRYTPPGKTRAISSGQPSVAGAPAQPQTQPFTAITRQSPLSNVLSDHAGLLGTLVSVMIGVGAGGLAVLVIRGYRKFRPMVLEPEGESRVEEGGRNRRGREKFCCSVCQKPLKKVSVSLFFPQLNKVQRLTQRLGSVVYEGWQCPTCSASTRGRGFHLRSYVMDRKRFGSCSTCGEFTAERSSRVVEQATTYSEGKRLLENHCHSCGDRWETWEAIPQLVEYSSNSNFNNSYDNSYDNSSWSSDSNYSSSSDSSSSDSSSSDSSSSDFGGGSSDSGGSGDNW
jgi:uncharacterized protein